MDNIPYIEPWVDADVVAKHLHCTAKHVRAMANNGEIPGVGRKAGSKTFWIFKISMVDAAYCARVSSVTSTPQNRNA